MATWLAALSCSSSPLVEPPGPAIPVGYQILAVLAKMVVKSACMGGLHSPSQPMIPGMIAPITPIATIAPTHLLHLLSVHLLRLLRLMHLRNYFRLAQVLWARPYSRHTSEYPSTPRRP